MTSSPEPPLAILGQLGSQVEDLAGTVETLAQAVNTERATTRRFRLNIAALLVLSAFNLVGLGFAYQAADDAGETSATLRSCLLPDGTCYKDLAQRGIQGGVRTLRFQYCALAILPQNRNEANLDACVTAAYPDVPNILTLVKEN